MTFHTKFIGYSDNLTKNSLSPALSLYPISTVFNNGIGIRFIEFKTRLFETISIVIRKR